MRLIREDERNQTAIARTRSYWSPRTVLACKDLRSQTRVAASGFITSCDPERDIPCVLSWLNNVLGSNRGYPYLIALVNDHDEDKE